MEFGIVGRDIRMVSLVTRRMLELNVRELAGDLVGRIHVAEGGGEDDVAAGTGEALDGALGVGAFRHAFEIGQLNIFLAEILLHLERALMVLVRPAEIADRPHIDVAGLGGCFRGHRAERQHGCRGGK